MCPIGYELKKSDTLSAAAVRAAGADLVRLIRACPAACCVRPLLAAEFPMTAKRICGDHEIR